MNELTALRKQIEREYQEKLRLEEAIMDTLRNKMTMDKAAHYAQMMAGNIRKRIADQVRSKQDRLHVEITECNIGPGAHSNLEEKINKHFCFLLPVKKKKSNIISN